MEAGGSLVLNVAHQSIEYQTRQQWMQHLEFTLELFIKYNEELKKIQKKYPD